MMIKQNTNANYCVQRRRKVWKFGGANSKKRSIFKEESYTSIKAENWVGGAGWGPVWSPCDPLVPTALSFLRGGIYTFWEVNRIIHSLPMTMYI